MISLKMDFDKSKVKGNEMYYSITTNYVSFLES